MARSVFLLQLFILSLEIFAARGQYTVSTCQQLNKAIEQSNAGGIYAEIRVQSSIDVSKCKGTTAISNSVSIVGVGSPPTISGGKSVQIFSVSSSTAKFELKNLVLINGKADYGGCVYIPYSSVSVSLSSVKFQGCTGTVTGGGLLLSGGPTVLNSVQFVGNVAQNGGAIYNQASDNDLIINGCNFTQNFATYSSSNAYGAAIYSVSKVNVSKSSFSLNRASSSSSGGYGGAIYCSNSVTISDSIFLSNSATSRDSEALGGALSTSSSFVTITNSKFEKNSIIASQGNGMGGAIYCGGVDIRGSQFNYNSVNAQTPSGGAIYSNQKASIFSSSFSFNTINSVGRQGAGGALYLGSYGYSSTVSQSNFSSNSISASGKNPTSDNNLYGGAIYSYDPLSLDRDLFTLNSISYTFNKIAVVARGGAVYCYYDLNISSSSFSSNTVYSAGSFAVGGAVYAESQLNILSSSLTGNNATSDCKSICDYQILGGGGVYASQQTMIELSSFRNNIFRSNSPKLIASGGAIFYAFGYSQSMTTKDCSFLNNRVLAPFGNASGGAIGASSYYQIFSNNSKFSGNAAIARISSGGAIYCGQSTLVCSNSTFDRNSADASSGNAYGGAIDSSSAQQNTILFSVFEANSVISRSKGTADGGAIFHGLLSSYSNGYPLKLGYSKFIGNSVIGSALGRGGALFIKDGHSAMVSNNYFVGSSVAAFRGYGGAIFAGGSAQLSFCNQNSFSSNNTAKSENTTVSNNIYTASSTVVTFCPSITVALDLSSTFKPSIQCQNCGCDEYFNPCDPNATCEVINSMVYCSCPLNAPGTGFICGGIDTCNPTL